MISLLDIKRRRLAIRASRALSLHDPREALHPNEAQAAHAFMRAGRLNAVANGVAEKLSSMAAELEADLLKELGRHSPLAAEDLPSLFKQFDRLVTSAFERMAREAEDDMVAIHDACASQAASALKTHFRAEPGSADGGSREALVLGAPLSDHFDKMASDLLFRLRAIVRQGAADGLTAEQIAERVRGEPAVKAGCRCHDHAVRAAAPPADVLIRLFDATDGSLLKVAKAAVTALANAADEATLDSVPDESGPPRMGFCWVSAQDGSVCQLCEFYDGSMYDENKDPVAGSPQMEIEPPAHYGCRCALVPCDLDGEVPQGSFDEYLDQFSDGEQRAAFGSDALEAYRKGAIGPGALMNQQDHAMSIEQFKQGEPELRFDLDKFERMGRASAEEANRRTALRRAGA